MRFCSTFRLSVSSLRSVFSDCPLVAVPFGTVSSCSPLIHACPPRCPLLFSPRSLSSYVRLACRLVMSSCRASRLVRSAASCRPSARSVRRSARRLVWRRFALLFARSRLVCRGVIALRSRAVSFRLGISFVISCRPPSRRLISSAVSFGFTRGCLGFVLVLGFRVRTVLSCCSLVPVRLFGLGSCPRSWGGAVSLWPWGGGACSSHLIRPLIMPAHYSLTRCGMALWEDVGYGVPFRVARRSSLARSCPIVLLITSDPPRPHCVLSFPHPRSKKAEGGSGGEGGIEQER